ncbi:helix-turn-helix domain-containing protein [Rhizobium halophytocola]|uniref:AraC-like DNA-binding protein n=1 Tax=Rhizobium halophytocola TaxID=735519 RepID=A0ABS4E0U8_9HYPH|nr:helix-turn-helix domain-containing protein [Rhizobium halophytocola]MBP1851555.1 AraC-like DNA-binding protein [Rhizobium halophytocola]
MVEKPEQSSDNHGVRTDRFTTDVHPPRQQFEVWREFVSSLMDVEPLGTPDQGFKARARAFVLGDMHLVSSTMDPMTYSHEMKHVAKSGIDHWCLSLIKKGQVSCTAGDRVLKSSAEDLHVKSLAYSFAGQMTGTESVCIFLSRDRHPELTTLLDSVSHQLLQGPISLILKDFILTADKYAENLKVSEVPAMVETLTLLLSAAVTNTADSLVEAEVSITAGRLNLARKYIQENLGSPDLDADSICRALEISRRQLYYLFEARGGVVNFIRQKRLAACCRAIADPRDQRLISTIAYAYGFTNQALFSRQFLAEYGFRPSEARAAGMTGHLPRPTPASSFAEWLV